MGFLIKIPFVVASHIHKFATITNLKNKNLAGAVGFNKSNTAAQMYAHNGTSVTPVSGYFGPPISLNANAGAITATPAQSGATFLLDVATGGTITLPTPQVGLWYDFIVTVAVTSNNYKVVTDVPGTTLLIGSIWETVAAGTGTSFFPNGSSHSAITMAGTTTGGLINTNFQLACITATQWSICGDVMASGTIATPFSNS